MSSENILFKPMKIGNDVLQHRIAMAPLTRVRADEDHTPSDLAIEYYGQRASTPGTLIITEATYIDAHAGGMSYVPGIWSDEAVSQWSKIVKEIHSKGSKVYMQLWALGRAAPLKGLQKEFGESATTVSASDIPLQGREDKPRPLTEPEIDQYVEWYARAAKNFVEKAGGDGCELHFANGYLINQFISTTSNKRSDIYGGCVENRTRFAFKILDAVTEAIGQEKTALRISPFSSFQDMRMPDDEIKSTFTYFTTELKSRYPNLAYLHVVLPRISGATDAEFVNENDSIDFIYDIWKPLPFMVAGGLTAETAEEVANKYENTAVAFGRYFISNPDLPLRVKNKVDFTKYDRSTFYVPGSPKGYIDYPFMSNSTKSAM